MSEFRDEHVPLGYLITFRAHGTWLHGDKRGSVDRFHNRFGTPRIAHNERWRKHNRSLLIDAPVKLESRPRALVEDAIRETCRIRKWEFWVMNARTNHVHTVVSAPFLHKDRTIRAISVVQRLAEPRSRGFPEGLIDQRL